MKPEKYNDQDTKKEGSPIETPFKYNDIRHKPEAQIIVEEEAVAEVEVEVEEDV